MKTVVEAKAMTESEQFVAAILKGKSEDALQVLNRMLAQRATVALHEIKVHTAKQIQESIFDDSVEELATRIKDAFLQAKKEGTTSMSKANLKQLVSTRGLSFANPNVFNRAFDDALQRLKTEPGFKKFIIESVTPVVNGMQAWQFTIVRGRNGKTLGGPKGVRYYPIGSTEETVRKNLMQVFEREYPTSSIQISSLRKVERIQEEAQPQPYCPKCESFVRTENGKCAHCGTTTQLKKSSEVAHAAYKNLGLKEAWSPEARKAAQEAREKHQQVSRPHHDVLLKHGYTYHGRISKTKGSRERHHIYKHGDHDVRTHYNEQTKEHNWTAFHPQGKEGHLHDVRPLNSDRKLVHGSSASDLDTHLKHAHRLHEDWSPEARAAAAKARENASQATHSAIAASKKAGVDLPKHEDFMAAGHGKAAAAHHHFAQHHRKMADYHTKQQRENRMGGRPASHHAHQQQYLLHRDATKAHEYARKMHNDAPIVHKAVSEDVNRTFKKLIEEWSEEARKAAAEARKGQHPSYQQGHKDYNSNNREQARDLRHQSRQRNNTFSKMYEKHVRAKGSIPEKVEAGSHYRKGWNDANKTHIDDVKREWESAENASRKE